MSDFEPDFTGPDPDRFNEFDRRDRLRWLRADGTRP